MKKINLIILSLGIVMFSCNTKSKVSEKDIDKIVESILDSNRVYDIIQSPAYSNDIEQYSAVEYSQSDSTVLLVETLTSQDLEYSRQLYFDNGKVVFVKEIGYQYLNGEEEEYEKKTYLLDNDRQKTYKKILDLEGNGKFKEVKGQKEVIDSKKAKDAANQDGDFEMKFGEFLIIEPQSYLILENKESKYNLALFIVDGDFLLDELYTSPEKYKGKTIFVNHETAIIGGIERCIYRGGFVIGS